MPLPDSGRLDAAHLALLRASGLPLFALGHTYGTPAVLAFLVERQLSPVALMNRHCRGDYGNLDTEDIASNDQAIIDGGRILSAYTIDGARIYCITEAEDDQGLRLASTLLFASEY